MRETPPEMAEAHKKQGVTKLLPGMMTMPHEEKADAEKKKTMKGGKK